MKRIAFISISALFILCTALVVFREQAVVFMAKRALHNNLAHDYTCKKIAARKGKISLGELSFCKEGLQCQIGELEVGFSFGAKYLQQLGKVCFSQKGVDWQKLLLFVKQHNLSPRVKNGVITIQNRPYYFEIKTTDVKHEICTISLATDPTLIDHPFLLLQFYLQKEELTCQVALTETATKDVIPLAALFLPQFKNLAHLKGEIKCNANLCFGEKGVLKLLSSHFTVEDFEGVHPLVNMQIQKASGQLHYFGKEPSSNAPIWENIQGKIAFEEGVFAFKEATLQQLDGVLVLDLDKEPKLQLKGELVQKDKVLALEMEGRGALHDDRAYWVELDTRLRDQKNVECQMLVSICKPEESALILQLEASHLLKEQMEMVKNYLTLSFPKLAYWQVKGGECEGKCLAFFEKGLLTQFEIQNLKAENLALTYQAKPFFFHKVLAEGRLFEQINVELDLLAKDFFGMAFSNFSDLFQTTSFQERVHLSSKMQLEDNKIKTAASVEFLQLKESLQFGFTSKGFPTTFEEIEEGWARSQKLSPALYAPFMRLIDEDLQLYGEVDVFALYENQKVELSLQVDNFLVKHPVLDLKALQIGDKKKTQGRAKVIFDVANHTISGVLPLDQASAYERQYGLVFTGIDGQLVFDQKQLKGQVTHANVSFDNTPLLEKAKFDFILSQDSQISNGAAKVCLNTDKNFYVKLQNLEKTKVQMQLLEEKETVASFTGKKEEKEWLGLFSTQALKDVTTKFSFDYVLGNAFLEAKHPSFSLFCKKLGQEYILEKLQTCDVTFSGVFLPSDKGVVLSNFQIQNQKAKLQGVGSFLFDLPTSQQSLGVRCQLDQAFVKLPLLELTSHQPMKLAFTPTKGWIASDLNFVKEGFSFTAEWVEHLFANQKTAAHKCVFEIAENVMTTFFEAGYLPPVLKDFHIAKNFVAKANCQIEKGETDFIGTICNGKREWPCQLKWKGSQAIFSIDGNNKDKLTFHVSQEGKDFAIGSIKGKLGSAFFDLKSHGKDQLQGHMKFDFAQIPTVCNLPINRHITAFNLGDGYQFDGIITLNKELKNAGLKGKLKGKNFAFNGKTLRHFEAKVDIEPGQVSIENFELSDALGKIWIAEGALMSAKEECFFSFPLVEVRGFEVSFSKNVPPILLKSANIQNVRGKIDDIKSMTGHGMLAFSRHAGNFPQEVLKTFGGRYQIDPRAVFPTSGEVSYIVQNGRLYIQGLRAVIGNQGKSEFLLPKSSPAGYVTLGGEAFVDLEVKQKQTPPVLLKVRGTLSDPQWIVE